MSTWFKENSHILSLHRANKKEFGFYEVQNGLSQHKKKVRKVEKVSLQFKNLIVGSKTEEEEKLQMDGQITVGKEHYCITAPP